MATGYINSGGLSGYQKSAILDFAALADKGLANPMGEVVKAASIFRAEREISMDIEGQYSFFILKLHRDVDRRDVLFLWDNIVLPNKPISQRDIFNHLMRSSLAIERDMMNTAPVVNNASVDAWAKFYTPYYKPLNWLGFNWSHMVDKTMTFQYDMLMVRYKQS